MYAKGYSNTAVTVPVGVLHTALQQAVPQYFALAMRAGRLVWLRLPYNLKAGVRH